MSTAVLRFYLHERWLSQYKTKSDKLQRYWSVQLASINHCDSITISAASVQMKAAARALKRQHHKKESFCRWWPHRLAPYHPFTLTTQFASEQQGHHSLVAFIPALKVWLYAAVFSWMISEKASTSALVQHRTRSLNCFPESLIFSNCFNMSSYIICESLSFCVDVSLKLTELHNCVLNLRWHKKTSPRKHLQDDATFVVWGEHKWAITPLDWFYATSTFWWSPHHCW